MPKPHKDPALLEQEGYYRTNPSRKPLKIVDAERVMPQPTELVQEYEPLLNCWHQLGEIFTELGTACVADAFLYEQLVFNLYQVRVLSRDVMINGHSIEATSGPKRSPNSAALAQAQQHLLKLFSQLGLTPSSRGQLSNMTIPKKDGEIDALSEIMSNLRGS